MNRRTFYYGQLVTAAELNDTYDQVELAEANIQIDNGIVGVQSGLAVSENTVPDLSVLISGGRAYDSNGRRVWSGSTLNLPIDVDSNNTSTAVVTPGNEKWVSIFAIADVTLSDLRPTLDGNTVYWREDEAIGFVVVQGSEAAIGVATRPSLVTGMVLLADFNLINGQTAVVNADIDPDPSSPLDISTRKQMVYALADTAPASVIAGTVPEAMQAILDEINNHVSGVANAHPADAITFDPTGTNFDAGSLDVEAALLECGVLAAPHPGNLWTTANRLRTHGDNGDWRDDALTRTWTFAAVDTVPGGGGNLDFKIGSWNAGDFELGYIELEEIGMYKITIEVMACTLDSTNPAFSYRNLLYQGSILRSATAVTVGLPAASSQDGNPGTIVLSVIAITNVVYIRAACAVALAGLDVRMVATARAQLVPLTA